MKKNWQTTPTYKTSFMEYLIEKQKQNEKELKELKL